MVIGVDSVVGLQWGDEGKGKVIDLLASDYAGVVRYNGGANAGHSIQVSGKRLSVHLVPSGVFHAGSVGVIGNGVVVDPLKLLEEVSGLWDAGLEIRLGLTEGYQELDSGSLVLSDRAHVVLPYHKAEDRLREARLAARAGQSFSGAIGTTGRGIGPAYADKASRANSIRVGDLLDRDHLARKVRECCALKTLMLRGMAEEAGVPDSDWRESVDPDAVLEAVWEAGQALRPAVMDTTYLLHDMMAAGDRLLFEGANATLLDVDHGTYPYITSSSTTALGVGPGSGVPGSRLERVIGVMKAYSTRVGAGPMPTELENATGELIRERGNEFGTTTGRPRRCGWLDLVAVKYAAMISGVTELSVMLLDVLGEVGASGDGKLRVCTGYRMACEGESVVTDRFVPDAHKLERVEPVYEEVDGWDEDISGATSMGELPAGARAYLELIERVVGVRVAIVSVGPGREQTIEIG